MSSMFGGSGGEISADMKKKMEAVDANPEAQGKQWRDRYGISGTVVQPFDETYTEEIKTDDGLAATTPASGTATAAPAAMNGQRLRQRSLITEYYDQPSSRMGRY